MPYIGKKPENIISTKIDTTTGTFSGEVDAGSLDISGNADIDGITNLDVVDIDGAVDMASTLGVAGVVTANAGVVVDNITIDGTEIDLSSGDLTVDVAGDIILSAAGGEIRFDDGSQQEFVIDMNDASTKTVLRTLVSDADLTFEGNDGGSGFTALTLDMSDAGTATFNHDVILGDNSKIKLGASSDLQIYHDGSNSYIDEQGQGSLFIRGANTVDLITADGTEYMARFQTDGYNKLYHNGSERLETTSGGVTVTGTVVADNLDISGNTDIDGTTNLDEVDIDGNVNIQAAVQMGASDNDVRMTLQGNNQYRLGLKNASNALVYLGSGGANNFRVSNSGGATLLELTSASNILLPTASAGIYLGVTSEATSNLLDDYEEGTWTPSLGGNTSYNSQIATYTKIGNIVHAVCNIHINAIGTGTANVLSGLPFTSLNNNSVQGAANFMYYSNIATSVIWISGYVRNNATSFYFSGGTVANTTIQHNSFNVFQDNARIDFSVTYKTA